MRGGKLGKFDTVSATSPDPAVETGRDGVWPVWARRAVSLALAFHLAAVLAGALGAAPASELQLAIRNLFAPYYQALDQGYTYRYYAPEPPPTPVVTARVRFADGRPEETLRLPRRGVLPRLRYQRQLALAYHLTSDFEEARRATGDGSRSAWARSYARHIARAYAGCASITLFTQLHLIPDPRQVREALEARRPVDLDAEEYYTAPERIGEFPCDGS
jgi:hypothetical protein